MPFVSPDLSSLRRRCANRAFALIIGVISFILSFPRLSILLPALLVFTCSYPYHYEYLMPRLTSGFADADLAAVSPQIASTILDLNHKNLSQFAVSPLKFVASNNSSTVLSPESLGDLAALQSAVATAFNGTVFTLSPWICLDTRKSSLLTSATIVRLFNSRLGNSLRDLFFSGCRRVDYLVTYAHDVSIYVFHPAATNVAQFIDNFVPLLATLTLVPPLPVHKTLSLLELSRILLYKVSGSWSNTPIHVACMLTLNFISVIVVALIYLALANEKDLRSQFGVFAAWMYSVYFSVGSAISLVGGFSNEGGPHAPLTRHVILLMVMVLSCGPFFQTLKDLTRKPSLEFLHKRILKTFTGYHGLPMIIRPLMTSLICVTASLALFWCILRVSVSPNTFSFMMSGCICIARITFVSMLIVSFLQLTFILAIISIDLKGVDFTEALDSNTGSKAAAEFKGGVNFLSSFLLKLNTLSHLRPKRTSWRYRVGVSLSQIHYPMKQQHRISNFTSILLLLILVINWYVTVPINLLQSSSGRIIFHHADIKSSHSVFFYAEWLLSSILFVVIFLIIFRLAYTRRGLQLPESRINLDSKDFENDARYFNNIDLVAPNGPTQDILLIRTNPTSPYLVSISLDHKILMWSPLASNPLLKPVNLSTTLQVDDTIKEFWPVNHVDISNDGNFIIIMNFCSGHVKCYERARMAYIWQTKLPIDLLQSLLSKKSAIAESFFRRRTVPGYLRRMGLLKKGVQRNPLRERSTSDASIRSDDSMFNGEFTLRPTELTPDDEALLRQMEKEDYVMVLNTGDLIRFSCSDGSLKITNMLREVGLSPSIGINLLCAKKVSTPRVNDRILCQTLGGELILAAISNNKWLYRHFRVESDSYDREPTVVSGGKTTSPIMAKVLHGPKDFTNTINEPTIVAVDFVGMVVRVCGDTAELIDLLNGIVLKSFIVGRFKPHTFKVSHLEPTHCKFCGCASIQSFSIIYEDLESKTVILHTFTIDLQRSKGNICLRVERDPREIRCAGFSAVIEHRYSYCNMEKWIVTDINIIVGFQDVSSDTVNDDNMDDCDEIPAHSASKDATKSGSQDFHTLVSNGGLASLRNRWPRGNSEREERKSFDGLWRCCIITALDGKKSDFKIRKSSKLLQQDFSTVSITCAHKYGYKSMCIGVGSYIGIFYLGSPALVEDDIYFSGSAATLPLDLHSSHYAGTPGESAPRQNKTVNSQLLFINKRRRGLDRPRMVDV